MRADRRISTGNRKVARDGVSVRPMATPLGRWRFSVVMALPRPSRVRLLTRAFECCAARPACNHRLALSPTGRHDGLGTVGGFGAVAPEIIKRTRSFTEFTRSFTEQNLKSSSRIQSDQPACGAPGEVKIDVFWPPIAFGETYTSFSRGPITGTRPGHLGTVFPVEMAALERFHSD